MSVSGLFKSAGLHPALQALAIVVGTFILEDAATVLAAMQVQDGKVAWIVALLALYVGIFFGDLGLYGLGRLTERVPTFRRWLPADHHRQGRGWVDKHVFRVVFVSRFIPGARLPSYTACGYLKASFSRFAFAAILATSIWTTLLFIVSRHVGQFLIDHLGVWKWSGAVVFALVIVLLSGLIARLRKTLA